MRGVRGTGLRFNAGLFRLFLRVDRRTLRDAAVDARLDGVAHARIVLHDLARTPGERIEDRAALRTALVRLGI